MLIYSNVQGGASYGRGRGRGAGPASNQPGSDNRNPTNVSIICNVLNILIKIIYVNVLILK